MTARAAAPGLEEGTKVIISIDQMTRDGKGSSTVEVIETEVSGGKVEATWAYGTSFGQRSAPSEVDSSRPVSDQMPVYVAEFTIPSVGVVRRTGLLSFQDRVRTQLQDLDTGEPLPDTSYRLLLANDEVREGTTDSDGWFEEDNVPPGQHEFI